MDEFVDGVEIVFDVPSVEVDGHIQFRNVDSLDESEVAGEDVFILVLADLHYAVADSVSAPEPLNGDSVRVERLLEN